MSTLEEIPTQPPPSAKERILSYNSGVISGKIIANNWIYAACKRFETDLDRVDIYFDWDEAEKLNEHFIRLSLVGEWSNKQFELQDWQLYLVSNIICWKQTEDHRKRYRMSVIQLGRGGGKSTIMAGLGLYDLLLGEGRRVCCLANSEEQALIVLNTAKTMMRRLTTTHDMEELHNLIIRRDADSNMTSLPALERNLQGLSPSMWIADEASVYKGRFLSSLMTTGAKRKEISGIIISTPGSNPENIYMEIIKNCEGILSGEVQDDATFAMLYGLDKNDELEDETTWIKANPGMHYGQPDLISLRRAFNTMKQSPMGRSEFSRYHASRFDENVGGWLDMTLWDSMVDRTITEEFLQKRPCYAGLDLSRSCDMTAFVMAFPLDDGRTFIKGRYFFPREGLAQRELDYRIPVRTWAKEGKLELSAGREIDYDQVRTAINEARRDYDLRIVCFDPWGSAMLAKSLQEDGVPLQQYRMNNSTFSPGCQIWQNLWMSKKLTFGDDPIMRRACGEAEAKRDMNGYIRPVKPREHAIIDPLVAGVLAIHSFGGTQKSIYEIESDKLNAL